MRPLGEQLYIFLVSKESLKIVIAPGKPEDLWKKIKTVRKQITTGESGGPLTKNLVALYDLLIAPIETELDPIKTIAFIPNQLLFYLPMQALAKKNAGGETTIPDRGQGNCLPYGGRCDEVSCNRPIAKNRRRNGRLWEPDRRKSSRGRSRGESYRRSVSLH